MKSWFKDLLLLLLYATIISVLVGAGIYGSAMFSDLLQALVEQHLLPALRGGR